ncbi:small integral membrane protein 22 [Myotis daubentonii]|uniref:small integral membrane protein 22 n=1 Tax=Myotis daubentonii TaxID=98922 RepID=UPI0028730984|nr:small integral membrane protein 22 [Myotis daubentonii]
MANLKDLETTAKEVLGRLKSNQLFESKSDTAYFIIFLIALGTILLLLLLVCLNCCCSPCCCYFSSMTDTRKP